MLLYCCCVHSAQQLYEGIVVLYIKFSMESCSSLSLQDYKYSCVPAAEEAKTEGKTMTAEHSNDRFEVSVNKINIF